jgi:hypothetical protein
MLNAGKGTIRKVMWQSVCAQMYFNICKETGVKLCNEHWYVHLEKLVGTSHEEK